MRFTLVLISVFSITFLFGSVLLSTTTSATTDTVVDKINVTVPVSCTLEGTGMNSHNAEINNGQYNSAVGETTIKAYCNDNEGFAIYAIGYTDNRNSKNVLTNSTLGSTYDIVTGTATTGNNSNWAMKLSTITSPEPTYPIAIQSDTEGSFTNFHTVPDDYTLVAKRTAGTDIGQAAEGSTLKTTYQAYISPTQAAGTYTGQVKYVLVHPHSNAEPLATMLDIGSNVNIKMKNLAAGTTNATTATNNTLIKAIHMANSLPQDFVATEANTVSVPESKYPIYIFFDNTNNAGIMNFYTEGDTIGMNPDSGYIFRKFTGLMDISGLADWDASNITSLYLAFAQDSGITSLSALSGWETSNLETIDMAFMFNTGLSDLEGLDDWDVSNLESAVGLFYYDSGITDISALADWNVKKLRDLTQAFEGLSSLTSLDGLDDWDTFALERLHWTFKDNALLSDISALSNWDVSNVIDMSNLFQSDLSLVDVSAVSNWDTRSVTTMGRMFANDSSIISIDISNWDTSNVTDMNRMFQVGTDHVGDGQLREIMGLGSLNVSNVTDMTAMFYGAGEMTHYDIANWDVSKVTSFNHMFCDNFELESLDLSKWNVSSVKTMYDMFDDNDKLITIGDVSHWNTASLIDLGGWLNGASSFVGNNGTLDLSGWNTSNLKVAGEAFRATKLETIDLSGWSFASITNSSWTGAGSGIYYEYGNGNTSYKALGGMFKNASLLNTVYVSQSGLNSYNTVVNNGVNITDMWTGSGASGFTVK